MFLHDDKILEMMGKESWEMLKKDAGDKKIFLIKEGSNMYILKI